MKLMKRMVAVTLAIVIALSCAAMAAAAGNKLNYLLLGDSIAAGAGVTNPDEASYGKIVANTNGYNYVNKAISGTPSLGLIATLKLSDVRDAISNANIISLSIGGNDFAEANWIALFNSALFTNYRVFDSIAERFASNFADIIETIRSINPKAKILVQTVYNPRCGRIFDGMVQQAVNRLNQVFYNYLTDHAGAYVIVDVASAISGHKDYISSDMLHPNANGNVVIARVVLNKLKEIGLGTKTEPVILVVGVDSDGLIKRIISVFSLIDLFGILDRIV